jgi:hypothetical protein
MEFTIQIYIFDSSLNHCWGWLSTLTLGVSNSYSFMERLDAYYDIFKSFAKEGIKIC